MEIKFGPSSLITIESSGYARPFDRTPVEEHTCRHPRRDVEGLVTASHCNAQLTCQDCCNHSCTAAITLTCWISENLFQEKEKGPTFLVDKGPVHLLQVQSYASIAPSTYSASFVGWHHGIGCQPPACKHVNIETWKKVLPWITGLYTHTHLQASP